jgi:GST-like protein
MITLYSWPTSNGRRASIMLEESGLAYALHPIDLQNQVQKEPWFLALNPYGRIPVLTDDDGPEPVLLFESGAILMHVAEKSGRMLPPAGAARAETLKWLFFQTSSVGPIGMQVHWLARLRDAGEPHPHLEIYRDELATLYGIMDRRLTEVPYLAGGCSVADIAGYPWVYRHAMQGIEMGRFPALAAWLDRMAARPAVRRGMNLPPRSDGM